ncbi:MAG: LysR substrate-binding domain-containing protein, partial [Polyangiaceae bacterium]
RRADLEKHVQLVLSDTGTPSSSPSEESYGVISGRLWRFVDLSRRLDFLLAGFGWCRMPEHLVAAPLASRDLVPLKIADDPAPRDALTIYAAHRRDHVLGPAGCWLLQKLRSQLA